MIKRKSRCLAGVTAGALLLCGMAGAYGADIEKADTDASLSDVGSWVGFTVPGSSDRAVWDSGISGVNASPLGNSMVWEGIQVLSPGGAISVRNTSGATLTLGDQGIDMSGATVDLTLAASIALGAPQTWNVTNGQSLNIQNSVSGTGPLTKAGAGTLNVGLGYSGDTVVSGGTLRVLDGAVPTDGLQLWLDASDAGSVSQSGGYVSTWADKSGNGNDATQGGSQPTYTTNAILPAAAAGLGRVLEFDGQGTFLNVNLGFLSGTPFTIIVMEIAKSKGGNYSFFIGNQSTGNNNNQALHTGYRTDGDFAFAQWGNDLDYIPDNGFTYPQARLWTDKLDTGSGHALYLNGTEVESDGDATPLGGPTLGQGYIGAGFDTTSTLYKGDLAEVLVYNRALSDSERSALENYLLAKWTGAGGNAIDLTASSLSVGNGAVLDVSTAPNLDLNGGQDLNGSGTVAGNVTVANDPTATIHPGGVGSAGTLTISSNLLFNGNATITFDLGGGANDLIVVNGALTPNSQASIVVNSAGQLNGVYTLFQYMGSANGNTFNPTVTFTGGGAGAASAVLNYDETVTPHVVQLAVIPAVPRLSFSSQPASTSAGVALNAVVVQVVDANGNNVSSNNVPVTLALNGGGTLGGTVTHNTDATGKATFNNLIVTAAGNHTLTARASGIGVGLATATSSTFNIGAGAPASLIIQTQPPGDAQVGVALVPAPVVMLVDQYSNACNSSATISVVGNGANLQGTTSVTASGGMAVFTNIYFATMGSGVTLSFSGSSLVSPPSSSISVSTGPVAGLAWVTQPGVATSGYAFGQQPVLKTVDRFGHPTTIGLQATQNVAVALSSGSGPLLGTTTYNIGTDGSDGVVTFTDLEIDTAGAGDQLIAFAGNGTMPTNLSNCEMWFDGADTNNMVVSSSQVSQWNDKSGNNNNAYQPYGGQQPFLATNPLLTGSLGGGNVLRFSGPAAQTSLSCDFSFLNGSDYTIIAMEIATRRSSSNYFIGNNTTGNNNNQALHVGYRSGDDFALAQWGNDIDYQPDAGFDYPQPRLWTVKLDSGAGHSIYLNGTQVTADGNTTQLYGSTLNQGHIGAGYDAAGTCFLGDLAEVIVYNRALSDSERSALESNLMDKWFTTLSPAVSQSFTVVGSGGGPPAQNITSVVVNPDGTVTITYNVSGGFTYHVESTTNLTSPANWTILPGSTTTPSSSGSVQFTDTNVVSGTQRYYRISSP